MKNNKIVNIIISLIVFVILLVIIILSNMNKEKVSFLEYISKNITKPFVNYKTFKENDWHLCYTKIKFGGEDKC